MPKKTPEEILRALEKPSLDEEMDRFLAMSPQEVNEELAKAGYTPEELEAEEEALFGPAKPARRTERKEPAKVVPLRPRTSQLWAKVAAAAVVLGPPGILALSEVGELTMVAAAPDAGSERLEAAGLRSDAADALEAGQWGKCIALLDLAKRKDPRGDEARWVKELRRTAMSQLGGIDGSRP